ncbi:hypothetical protein MMC18_000404 [Xylographa bjoerkii]|nr:hypothetical protein [Xylographa bjoerkii]
MRFASLYPTRTPSHQRTPSRPSSQDIWTRTIALTSSLCDTYLYVQYLVLPAVFYHEHYDWLLACFHTITDAQKLLRTPITPEAPGYWSTCPWYLKVYDRVMAMLVTNDELLDMTARLEKLAADMDNLLDKARAYQIAQESRKMSLHTWHEQQQRSRRWE